jgi:hypothetical protein
VEIYGTARKITDDNIIRLIHFPCWVTMVSHIHNYSNISSFPQQLWLRERVSTLRYTYITSLVNPHTYLLSKLRVARGYCTVCGYVVHYKWLVCTNNAEESKTAWLRHLLQPDHPLHQYVCLQNLYNYTTEKHYKDAVKTEFCSPQNRNPHYNRCSWFGTVPVTSGTKAPIIMRIPILHD